MSSILIAPGRTSRPKDAEVRPQKKDPCPFCPGSESMTPPTLFSLPEGDRNWKVRVFSNLYPLVSSDISSEVYGIHEVIVDSPEHDVLFRELPSQQILLVLQAARERIKHHSNNEKLVSFIAFRNQGFRGGASLDHPHTQLVGLSWIPPRLSEKISAFSSPSGRGRCPLCLDEVAPRIITECDGFRAFLPEVPRFSREVWIAPIDHQPSYVSLTDRQLNAMSLILRKVLKGLSRFYSPFDYNLVLYTKPVNDNSGSFHTHMEIIPRSEAIAGFELGSGMLVNPQVSTQLLDELRDSVSEDT